MGAGELDNVDENSGTAKQVGRYRNLVQQQNVDIVVGYSSGDCLVSIDAVREGGAGGGLSTAAHLSPVWASATSTCSVCGPRHHERKRRLPPAAGLLELKSYAGINQNYAWTRTPVWLEGARCKPSNPV